MAKNGSLLASMWQKVRIPVISIFLVWHFTGVILWLCPNSLIRHRLLSPFIGYINFFGLWQGWSLFDNPTKVNYYLTALVTFRDGTEKIWAFPRMDKLPILAKMHKERYRKWAHDVLNDERNSFLWADAVRYVARQNYNSHNPPVAVCLVRHWSRIPPPKEGLGKPLPDADDGQSVLYMRDVTAEDLK